MRRALSLALVLTLAAGIFTGCGGSASAASQGGQAAATPEPTATPEPYEANALTGEGVGLVRLRGGRGFRGGGSLAALRGCGSGPAAAGENARSQRQDQGKGQSSSHRFHSPVSGCENRRAARPRAAAATASYTSSARRRAGPIEAKTEKAQAAGSAKHGPDGLRPYHCYCTPCGPGCKARRGYPNLRFSEKRPLKRRTALPEWRLRCGSGRADRPPQRKCSWCRGSRSRPAHGLHRPQCAAGPRRGPSSSAPARTGPG